MLYSLATEFSDRTGTPLQSCANYYAEPTPQGPRPYALRPRAGLVLDDTIGEGPVWTITEAGGYQYVLSGAEVYKDGSLIGTVASGGQKQVAVSDEQLVIVSGWTAYYIDYLITPATLTQITDPDLPQVSGVVFAGGRFVYPVTNSGTYYWSEINDASNIDGLGFANTEANPDPIVRAAILGDQIAFFGTRSLEFHSLTNDPAAPFQRASGQTQDKGCLAPYSVVKADNSLFWIGQDEGSGRLVFRTSGGVPQIVSTPTISARIQRATLSDLAISSAIISVQDGHTFYAINVENVGSYALDVSTNKWAQWTSYGSTTFRLQTGPGPLYGGPGGGIYRFDDEAVTDDGDPIERLVSVFIPIESKGKCNVIVLEMATGISPLGENTYVEMRYSDQLTGDFSAWDSVSLGEQGDRSVRVFWWQLGTMHAPGRLFQFRITDTVQAVPYDIMMNVRP